MRTGRWTITSVCFSNVVNSLLSVHDTPWQNLSRRAPAEGFFCRMVSQIKESPVSCLQEQQQEAMKKSRKRPRWPNWHWQMWSGGRVRMFTCNPLLTLGERSWWVELFEKQSAWFPIGPCNFQQYRARPLGAQHPSDRTVCWHGGGPLGLPQSRFCQG